MLYLIIGPSGSGKTTLGRYLETLGIQELISTTTREPRAGESEGSPYYFVDRDTFNEIPMIEQTTYAGNLYGTTQKEADRVLSEGDDAYAIVDRHGAIEFKRYFAYNAKVIFVYAPLVDLLDRMMARGDANSIIKQRIEHAKTEKEFNNLEIADYCIVNTDLQRAQKLLKTVVEIEYYGQ